jgi:cytoskeletal protein RodZ
VFEIGSSLREARERQDLDFAEVERMTKVRGKYLRALEDERFELLPAQTYVKGFLRTYAEVLGLDGQLYVDEYNSRYVVGDDEAHFRPRRTTVRTPQQRSRRVESKVVLLALGAIAVLTVVVIGAWTSGEKGGTRIDLRAKSAKPATHAKSAIPSTGVLLVVSARRGNSQLEIHSRGASGPLRYQGTIEKGSPPLKLWAKRFWINVATPENLTFAVNGHRRYVPGGSPRVVTITRTGLNVVSSA